MTTNDGCLYLRAKGIKKKESKFFFMIVFAIIKIISVTLNSSYVIYGSAKKSCRFNFFVISLSIPFVFTAVT